jgi:hypothetical protein
MTLEAVRTDETRAGCERHRQAVTLRGSGVALLERLWSLADMRTDQLQVRLKPTIRDDYRSRGAVAHFATIVLSDQTAARAIFHEE